MNVHVHILACDEQHIIGYALRHYQTFASRIVVHDALSTDGTREVAKMYGVEVRDWKTDGINDALAKRLKETCWRGRPADWVACVDCDELIYFPQGAAESLAAYDHQNLPVVTPYGFEMFSDNMPTTDGQIYDEIKQGCPEDEWYAKKVLFSPKRVRSVEFSAGAHETWYVDRQGTRHAALQAKSDPPTYYLHFRHIGGLERSAERYARQQARHSKTNITNKWGNFAPPEKHAMEKRERILAGLRQVIA